MSLLDEFKKIKSTRKELREFAFVVGGVLGALGILLWWKHKNFIPILSCGSLLIVLGAVWPDVLKPFQKIWMAFALVMGSVMTRVLMFLLFFLALTPIRIIALISGKKFISDAFRTNESTYWIPRSQETVEKTRYEKQF